MKKSVKILLFLFVLLSLAKVLLAFLVVSPTVFADEYLYVKFAQSVAEEGTFALHGNVFTGYPPLYPLLLSVAYVFDDMTWVYRVMQIVNAVLSSLLLFPAFLLLREFFSEKGAVRGAFVLALAPMSFAIAPYLMAENVFYPLFLSAVYCVMKVMSSEERKFMFWAGGLIGLSVLTKYSGAVLFAAVGFAMVYMLLKKEYAGAVRLGKAVGVALVVLAPWVVFAMMQGDVGNVVQQATVEKISTQGLRFFIQTVFFTLVWAVAYGAYLILASGGLGVVGWVKGWQKDARMRSFFVMTGALLLCTIGFLSVHAATGSIKEITLVPGLRGRLIGRYVDMLLPLVIVSAALAMKNVRDAWKRMGSLGVIGVAGSVVVLFFPLVPFNNNSLTVFGVGKILAEYFMGGRFATDAISLGTLGIMLGVIGLMMWCALVCVKKGMFWRWLAIFFIVSSMFSVMGTWYNAKGWDAEEQVQLGKELEKYEFTRLIVDEKACTAWVLRDNPASLCTPGRQLTLVGFWVSKPVEIRPVAEARAGDVVVTRQELNEKRIKKTQSGINVYQM